jgi:hypothetical protein
VNIEFRFDSDLSWVPSAVGYLESFDLTPCQLPILIQISRGESQQQSF